MITLIFPATTASAFEYARVAAARGEKIIAASSVDDAQAESVFGTCKRLPFIYDASFVAEFLKLVHSANVTHVMAPVTSVYTFVQQLIAREHLPIEMIGSSPITEQVEKYRALLLKAKNALVFIERCAQATRPLVSQIDVAAIYRNANNIYGESNDDKIAAMMAIFATAPEGDVIEIGSLIGKSASVLQYLSQHYNIGAVLSVDPLAAESSIQHSSPEPMRTSNVEAWDFAVMRAAVAINTLPSAGGRFNYLRMESEHGFHAYCANPTVSSPEFGETTYAGNISVIHIDGNHDFVQVTKDCELWLQRLVPGAWLILDDYEWAHGDGPKRVGDAFLEARRGDIQRSFVHGKALFVKMK